MSNYTKATNFASKDSLLTGNPLKIVKGTEIDNEFNAIATAVSTKFDTSSLAGSLAAPTPIGTTTPNIGAFSSLSSSGTTTANALAVTTTSTFTGVASFTGTPTGAGLTARFSTPGPIGDGTASTGNFTTCTATTFSGSGASLTSIPAAQLTGDVAQARLATALNASGSAPLYAVRAWGSFVGTAGTPAMTGGNFGAITDNGTGNYTLAFSTAMPNANYAVAATITGSFALVYHACGIFASGVGTAPDIKTTTAVRVAVSSNGAAVDPGLMTITIVC